MSNETEIVAFYNAIGRQDACPTRDDFLVEQALQLAGKMPAPQEMIFLWNRHLACEFFG